ncbi:MAG: Trm112 family protein [Hyphomicrobiaceae bacterium TMED74]|nr:hypothetical protein [Filomicrobium sp.]RPG41718.1 MAG: Trm112 family protein [Hyphomicrobiaceae bacterium TMED74]
MDKNLPEADNQNSDRKPDISLLELLVCPITKESLKFSRESNELISRGARLAFPIIDGIPLMVPDAARELNDDE